MREIILKAVAKPEETDQEERLETMGDTPRWKALKVALHAIPRDVSPQGLSKGLKLTLVELESLEPEAVATRFYENCRRAMKAFTGRGEQ